MSEQRERTAVDAAHRSIYPNIAGVPWWTALLFAVTTTAIGYGIDAGSGHKELTSVFAGLYVVGCVAAVLAVRQDGVFTTVIQPPLILFCAVPGAYWLFHGGKVGNLKDLLINCGYPLIERFPLMLGTAGGILLIGLIRWYFGMSHRSDAASSAPAETADGTAAAGAKSFFISGISAKLNSLLGIDSDDEDADEASRGTSKRRQLGTYFPAARVQIQPRRTQRSAQRRVPAVPGRRWTTCSTRAIPGSSSADADARRRHVTTIPPNRRAERGGGRGHRPIPTSAASRRGKTAATRAATVILTSVPRRAAADSTATTATSPPGAAASFNRYGPNDSHDPPSEPRRRRRHRTGRTAPTRVITRSRRSATAGQARTSPARSAKAGPGQTAGPRPNRGSTTPRSI